MPERSAFTIPEFCARHNFSDVFFYKLKKQGLAPRIMNVLNRRLITRKAELDWQRDREKDGAVKYPPAAIP